MKALAADPQAIYVHTSASPLFDRARLGLTDSVIIATPPLPTADFHLFIGHNSPYPPLLTGADTIVAAMKCSGEWKKFSAPYL